MQAAGTKTEILGPALLVLSGMFIIGLIDNFVPQIATHAGLWQFHFTRAAMAVPMIVVLAKLQGLSLRPKRWGAVLARSTAMTIAMLLYFGALALLPISAVVAGLFTAPGFVLIFSVALFGVNVGAVRVVAVLIGFCGAVLVLDPDFSDLSWLLAMPIVAGLFYALNALLLRHFCAQEETLVLLLWFFAGLGVAGFIGMLLLPAEAESFVSQGWVSPSWPFLGWCLLQAVGSIIAVGLLTRAYQSCDPSYLSIFEYSLLISASFWAWAFFGQTLSLQGAFGMALIIASGATIALRSGRG